MQRLECFLKSFTNIYFLKLSNSARVCNRLGERFCFETSQYFECNMLSYSVLRSFCMRAKLVVVTLF